MVCDSSTKNDIAKQRVGLVVTDMYEYNSFPNLIACAHFLTAMEIQQKAVVCVYFGLLTVTQRENLIFYFIPKSVELKGVFLLKYLRVQQRSKFSLPVQFKVCAVFNIFWQFSLNFSTKNHYIFKRLLRNNNIAMPTFISCHR